MSTDSPTTTDDYYDCSDVSDQQRESSSEEKDSDVSTNEFKDVKLRKRFKFHQKGGHIPTATVHKITNTDKYSPPTRISL